MHKSMNLEEKLLAKLNQLSVERRLSEIAERAGVDQSNISRALGKNKQKLGLDKVSRLLEALGAEIFFPEDRPPETARDVCFVNARIVPAGNNQVPPDVQDYMAVPVVEEVGAGPGLIPQGELLSWFLVYKHQDAVRYKRNLIAVQIGKNSTSMEPTLCPRDIVLVDKDDRDASTPGRIMLVLDEEGCGMIKRVKVEEVDRGRDFRIMYYSDNAKDNPPLLYSLRNDFLGEWDRAIVGRVIWAWSDISQK